MWELDYKEGWALKNWCFWTVVLVKTLESPLDSKEIKPVSPKGNQPWLFIGWTDAKAKAPILWPPDVKSWLTGKGSDAGKGWGQEEKGVTEDEMVGCLHWPICSKKVRRWRGTVVLLLSEVLTAPGRLLKVNLVLKDSSVAQSCPTLCDPMDCSTPGFPVLHYLPEFAQTHVLWVDDAIQPSHPLSLPSLPSLNLS